MESLEAHLSELHASAFVNQATFRVLVHAVLTVAHEQVGKDVKEMVLIGVIEPLEL